MATEGMARPMDAERQAFCPGRQPGEGTPPHPLLQGLVVHRRCARCSASWPLALALAFSA
jgi:hypothetical protein